MPEATSAPADDRPVTTEPETSTSPDATPEATPAPADDLPVTAAPQTATPTDAKEDEPPRHPESGAAETGSKGTGAPAPVDAWPAAAATVAPGTGVGTAGKPASEAAAVTGFPDRPLDGAGEDGDEARGGDDNGDDDEVDGDEPPAGKSNLLTKEVRIDAKTLLGLVAAVILVGLAFGAYQLGQRESQEAGGDATKPTSSTAYRVPKDFVPLTDPETGVTISIPTNWVRYSIKDLAQKPVRLAAGIMNTGDSMTVRVNAYSTEITEANLADQKSVFDDLLATENIQVLVDKATKLGNLPALFYVYRFQDEATGKSGVHAQYFVFQGRKMVSLVLQALPEDRYSLLASTFDVIAESLKVAPGPPPAFLENLAGTPTTTAPGGPTTTTAVGATPPSSAPATSTP